MTPKIMDFFAGIGGIRIGFEMNGFECAGACEFEKYCKVTYGSFFGHEPEYSDVNDVDPKTLPPYDVFAAGFPCFVPGTLILTKSGYTPIEELQVGDLVLTHERRWKSVTSVMRRENAPLRKLLVGGIPIITTDEHPFLAMTSSLRWDPADKKQKTVFSNPEWVEAKDLTRKHRGLQILPKDEVEDDRPLAFWWLVGNYLAEGWVRKRYDRKTTDHGIVLACNPKDVGFVISKVIEAGYHGTLAEEGAVSKIHVLSNALAEFISEFGEGAANKRVPSWVFGVAPEKAAALLDGYFFGDGHGRRNPVGKGSYRRTTSVGKALSLSMVLLAQRAFDIVASVTYTDRPEKHVIQGREVNQKPTWQVTVPERNRVNRIVDGYGLRFVRRNEPAGYGTVYNISVAEDESYVADGVVVHNCQPFSLAGISKRNDMGLPSGFEDETRGTLFFNISTILNETRPKAFLLENVKNLRHHDKGRTFDVIARTLDDIGYDMVAEVIDSRGWVPQHRERIYMVGVRKDLGLKDSLSSIFDFEPHQPISLADILEDDPDEIYGLSEKAWLGLQEHKRRHEAAGHGFGYGLIEPPFDGKVTKTLLARYYKDGSEILISRGPDRTPRRLTPLECLRLQGFPREYERFFDGTLPMPVSKTQAYKQFGNSVSVPVISAIARNLTNILEPTYDHIAREW